jgi:lytic murein transglycosylase
LRLALAAVLVSGVARGQPVAQPSDQPTERPVPDGMIEPADAPPEAVSIDGISFAAWLAGYRAVALARGVNPATLDTLLSGVRPSSRVVQLDRGQPDDSGSAAARFDAYLARRLDAGRINAGNAAAGRMSTALATAQAQTGVPASIILGIWGMESSYGVVTGNFDVVRSMATLAWDGRRRALFTRELDATLAIVERGLASPAMLKGSWAGAMGQPQFLPSSYLAYGRDGDGDGRIDIWGSASDTIASIANFLARNGWQAGKPWGMPVVVPPTLDRENIRDLRQPESCVRPLLRHSRWITAGEWRALGVAGSTALPDDSVMMTLVEPDGPGQGAYLTTENYRAIMRYNCSNFYALSVALLGDKVATPGQ